MLKFVAKRIAISCLTLVGISTALFALLRAMPGDPASMFVDPLSFNGDQAAARLAIQKQLGLDRSLPIQYVDWLNQAVHGNLGFSYQTGQPVAGLLGSRISATAYLVGGGLAVALVFGVLLGVVAALRHNTALDYAISTLSIAMISVPSFFLALLGIYFFGLRLQLLPTAGINDPQGDWWDAVRHLIMPTLILGLSTCGTYVRWARSSMLDVSERDFLVTARSKGASAARVVVRHALPNALIPLITVFAASIPSLLGGAVIIEQIFAWPGTGSLVLNAITNRDYPVLMGFVMLTAMVVLACNLLADLANALVDPRIKL